MSSFAGDAMEKILKDQEEFEKEHQFMQVYISSYFFSSSYKTSNSLKSSHWKTLDNTSLCFIIASTTV